MRNYVIEYEDWDTFEADSEKEALQEFKKVHPTARILRVVE